MSEEKSKERLIFEETIEKLRIRLDSENFERIEDWVKKIEAPPIKKNRLLLFIRKKPIIVLFLIIIFSISFILFYSLPSKYFPYLITITVILSILSILPCTCPPLFQPPNLDEWLEEHPNVRVAIKWEFPEGAGIKNYSKWEVCCKDFLQNAFEFAWFLRIWDGLTIVDPPPNQYDLDDDDEAITGFDRIHAYSLYMAYVAHCLAIEIKEKVPWSILEYNQDELEFLFDGTQMFDLDLRDRYTFYKYLHGNALPAPPDFTYFFFKRKGFIGSNRIETISRIINWSRDNLIHFLIRHNGNPRGDAQDMEAQWQYRGTPPVSRIIDGSTSDFHPEWGLVHITAGCFGTLGFYRSIFRSVNIPIKTLITESNGINHAQICFLSENKYLWHGDDPYDALSKATPLPSEESQLTPGESLLPPAREILIDQVVYDEWREDALSSTTMVMGRRTAELAIIYLPDRLLYKHCLDKYLGNSPENSEVYESLEHHYSVDFLEEQNLWTRLDEKIAAWGGCDALPEI